MGLVFVALVILIVLMPPIAYKMGLSVGREGARLDKNERKELQSYRDQEDELIEKASEAATLGDDFGVTALSIISKNRIERRTSK